jgi:HSP20 family protein
MALIRYQTADPFQGIQDTINRLFTEPAANRPWVPAVDIRETDHELVLKADIPDMKFEDIDVRMENGTLTLKGERKFEQEEKQGGWHRVERNYGSFERAFTLPETVNPEGAQADYKNGVLTVTLPKKEIAKPRQIKVKVQ